MVRPKFENFHSYCEERKYKKYGFDAKAVFDSLNGNCWLLPNGECPKKGTRWKAVVDLYYTVAKKKAMDARKERRRVMKQEKRKISEEKRKERLVRWHETRKRWFHAYTDGSCNNLSPYGEGGSAYVILKDGVPIHEAKYGRIGTTNNRMEMLAIISAVNWLPPKSSVVIYSDSMYAINVFSGRWRAKTNLDLVRLYDTCAAKLDNIEFYWVKGHSGVEWNEYVDNLANSETERVAKEYNIPLYTAKNSPKCRR